jgi:hypothetical protein
MGLQLVGVILKCKPTHLDKLNHFSITIGMEQLRFKEHFRWVIWKVIRETQGSFVETTSVRSSLRTLKAYSPFKKIIVDESH